MRHFQIGQQVFGALHPTATRGTYSDYAILGEEQLAPKPESLSHMVYGPSNYPCFPLIHVFLQIIYGLIVWYVNIPIHQSPMKSSVFKAEFNDIVMMLWFIITFRLHWACVCYLFLGHQTQICHDSCSLSHICLPYNRFVESLSFESRFTGIHIFTIVIKYKFVKLNFWITYFFKECTCDFSLTSLTNNRNVTCVCFYSTSV